MRPMLAALFLSSLGMARSATAQSLRNSQFQIESSPAGLTSWSVGKKKKRRGAHAAY